VDGSLELKDRQWWIRQVLPHAVARPACRGHGSNLGGSVIGRFAHPLNLDNCSSNVLKLE